MVSDALFLSQGSLQVLALPGGAIPATMAEFLSHIPAPCLPAIQETTDALLDGSGGSFAEISFPFGNAILCQRMVALERNAQGRCTRLMGQFAASLTNSPQKASMDSGNTAERVNKIGYWFCSLTARTLQMNSVCAALLGYPEASLVISLDEWKRHLHPEDGNPMECRYRQILESPLHGDTIIDELQLERKNGDYVLVQLRGGVMERSEDGRACTLVGLLQNAEIARTEARQENGRLLFAMNATGDGLWDWDAQTDSVYFSPRYLSMLGYTSEEFPGRLDFWKGKIHQDDHDKIVHPQAQIVESPDFGDTFECTYRLMRADNSWAWILGRGYVTHRDTNGRATRLVGLHTDVTTLQNERENLENLIKNDILTGLRSRTYCDMTIARIEKNGIRPVSVIYSDICGLKLINDYMGHATGDQLLRKAAMMLRNNLRATDCIARTGGDEFIILLPGCTEEKGRDILRQTEEHFASYNADPEKMPVLISFGLACTTNTNTPLARVLMDADRIMLHDKQIHRKTAHQRIKAWIERNTHVAISIEDSRYES